jgi:hypothetical protein
MAHRLWAVRKFRLRQQPMAGQIILPAGVDTELQLRHNGQVQAWYGLV